MQAPKAAQKAFERAGDELRQNKPDHAEKHLQAAVAVFPKFAEAWYALGLIHEQRRRVDDARSMFSRAIDADDKFVSPYVELARLAGVERKWQEVVDLTNRALALNPLDIPEGFYFNALANFNLLAWKLPSRARAGSAPGHAAQVPEFVPAAGGDPPTAAGSRRGSGAATRLPGARTIGSIGGEGPRPPRGTGEHHGTIGSQGTRAERVRDSHQFPACRSEGAPQRSVDTCRSCSRYRVPPDADRLCPMSVVSPNSHSVNRAYPAVESHAWESGPRSPTRESLA